MKRFEDFVAAVQVGVRRAPALRSETLPDWEGTDLEKTVLVEVGALELMRRAGATGRSDGEPIKAVPLEALPIAQASAEPLSEALDLGLIDAVLEWMEEAQRRKRVAPSQVLVRLLELAPKLGPTLTQVLGERGKWLATLMDVEIPEVREPETSSALRARLAAEFDDLDWKERAARVAKLRSGLSEDDEPLLDRALTDRRKEVRERAWELLCALPESSPSRQLAGLGCTLFRVEKRLLKKSLEVVPPNPEDLPKALPRTSKRWELGPRALALFDVVRFTPPTAWQSLLPPEAFIDLAVKSEYAKAVFYGVQEAAIRFENSTWLDALGKFPSSLDCSFNEEWFELAHHLNSALFEQLMLRDLKGPDGKKQQAVLTIVVRKEKISAILSTEVLTALPKIVGGGEMLQELVTLLHPSANALLEHPSDDPHFESVRKKCFRALDLRGRLLASLDR